MKKYFFLSIILGFIASGEANAESKKILIAYFSHSGNTRIVAEQIQNATGGELFEIKTVTPYPEDYDVVVKQAKQELTSGFCPELKTKVENIAQYDMIFIGYPNWWNTIPAPVRVFLTSYDFTGKTLIPFCTHGGGGIGKSVSDISKFCPKSNLLKEIGIPGNSVRTASEKVIAWLKNIKVLQ